MKGRLLLFDLGFYRATLFQEVDRHGGCFLSRMKQQGNPRIVRAEMGYACRQPTPPLVTNHHVQFRCVALYEAERKTWHRYVTNLPIDKMKPEHLGAVYAARWEVELLRVVDFEDQAEWVAARWAFGAGVRLIPPTRLVQNDGPPIQLGWVGRAIVGSGIGAAGHCTAQRPDGYPLRDMQHGARALNM